MPPVDKELQTHSRRRRGIQSPWQGKNADLTRNVKRVQIDLAWIRGTKAPGPVCGQEGTLYDAAPERTGRHLDTMQFATILRARVPRVECPQDGGRTIAVPGAEPGGRFTRLFGRWAIDVLLRARRLTQAAGWPGRSWDEGEPMLRRAVARGLARRELEGLAQVGIDEKSGRAGQSHVSRLTDPESRRGWAWWRDARRRRPRRCGTR